MATVDMNAKYVRNILERVPKRVPIVFCGSLVGLGDVLVTVHCHCCISLLTVILIK